MKNSTTATIQLRPDVYELLRRSYGETMLREKANDIFLQGVIATLERYSRDILLFEEKYGCSFREFEQLWDAGRIAEPHSHTVESDFIDWEMLENEKRTLLRLVTQIRHEDGA
jgi:hypothetical protein